jgi:hypothetical protein
MGKLIQETILPGVLLQLLVVDTAEVVFNLVATAALVEVAVERTLMMGATQELTAEQQLQGKVMQAVLDLVQLAVKVQAVEVEVLVA